MSDRAAFLRGIQDRPDDDLTRFVFADWLDDTGRPEDASHAAAIRRHGTPAAAHREDAPRARWNWAGDAPADDDRGAYASRFAALGLDRWPAGCEVVVRRGFVEAVRGPFAAFWANGGPVSVFAELARREPVEYASVTDDVWQEGATYGRPGGFGWWEDVPAAPGAAGTLPQGLFVLLWAAGAGRRHADGLGRSVTFPNEGAARAALSAVLLDSARGLG